MSFVWTADVVQTAIELWNAGETGGVIATAIGAPSRGSVTRQISRLRAQGIPVEAGPSSIKPKLINVEAEMPVIRVVRPAHGGGPVSLLDATFRQCRYPLWHGRSEPKLVCGKRTRNPKSSWCEEHFRLIWRTGDTRTQSDRC